MYEYKVVPAPARAAKVRGLKTTGERFSHALTEVLNDLGAEGWEYLRSETLPCEERKGWFGGTRTSTQIVLIFGRLLPAARSATAQPALRAETAQPALRAEAVAQTAAAAEPVALREPLRAEPRPELRPEPRPEPRAEPRAEPQRAEPVFRSGAMLRAEGERRFPPLRQADEGQAQQAVDDDRR
jgi:hypothetical protein